MSIVTRFWNWLVHSGSESVTEPTVPVSVMEKMLLQQRETILLVMQQMNPMATMQTYSPGKLWYSEEDEEIAAVEAQQENLLDTEEKATAALNLYLEQMGLEGNAEVYEG